MGFRFYSRMGANSAVGMPLWVLVFLIPLWLCYLLLCAAVVVVAVAAKLLFLAARWAVRRWQARQAGTLSAG